MWMSHAARVIGIIAIVAAGFLLLKILSEDEYNIIELAWATSSIIGGVAIGALGEIGIVLCEIAKAVLKDEGDA